MRYLLLSYIFTLGITINLQGQDCQFFPLPIIQFDSCDFDLDNCFYLEIPDSSNTWEIGVPQKVFFEEAHTLPYAIMTDSINPYPKNNNDFVQIDIPVVDEIFWSSTYVDFWHKFQFDTLNDGGYYKVSFNESPYFSKVELETNVALEVYCDNTEFCGYNYEFDDIFADSINGYTGSTDGWVFTRILFIYQTPVKLADGLLKTLNVEVDTIHIRFYILTDSIEGGEAGWIIDDILYGVLDMQGGISHSENRWQIKTYPNPVSNEVTLFMEGLNNENIDIDLFDITGSRIKSFENIFTDEGGYTKIDLNDIPNGIWTISITSENEFWTTKIIKQ